jgi:ATP/maltotriose-dependent transcriptional regulator MalT/DNA-binding SARP family transcriptional activator
MGSSGAHVLHPPMDRRARERGIGPIGRRPDPDHERLHGADIGGRLFSGLTMALGQDRGQVRGMERGMGAEGPRPTVAVTAAGAVERARTPETSATGPSVVRRPVLERRLDDVRHRRLIVIVAGPGFGKSSLLHAWVRRHFHAWHDVAPRDLDLGTFLSGLLDAFRRAVPGLGPALTHVEAAAAVGGDGATADRVDAVAEALCSGLDTVLESDLLLVLDDLHELAEGTASARLVAGICRRAPARLHLVLGSRDAMPFPLERMAAHGDVGRFDARDLAFTADEVAALLAVGGHVAADGLPGAIVDATDGWPAAVRLVIESLAPGGGAASIDVSEPDGPLFAYLASEVFERAPASVRDLIRRITPLDSFTDGLAVELGVPDAKAAILWLTVRGLFVRRVGDRFILHDLVREFARRSWPLDADGTSAILALAAGWHDRNGDPTEALALAARSGDVRLLTKLVTSAGPGLVRAGGARAIVEAAERLPAEARDPMVARIVGEAYASMGLSDAALGWLERAIPDAGPIPADVAWRLAMSHYLRDELDRVIELHERADLEAAAPADLAHLTAWAAGAYRRLGDAVNAARLAADALDAAERSGDDRARAAAHTAGAFGAEIAGDRVGVTRHQRLALAAAERAGDLLQVTRIRINQASELLESGSYALAIRETDTALEIATLAGFGSLRALALMNRGLAAWCLGRLEEASAAYEASIEAYRAAGSRELAYALIGRADVYRERGDLELARGAYDEGLALAERTGDRQALVPGLYQSAKVIAFDDPAEARARAERAVAYGWPDRAWALVALGWVLVHAGERARAREAATEAAAAARAAGDRFGVAEALELRTWAAEDPGAERDGLLQAASIWRELGNGIREATVELALARMSTGHGARAAAQAAETRLQRLGVRPSPVGPAGLLTAVAGRGLDPIEIRTLGGFRVLREGAPIALPEWQSKKARDLLKLLVARRGHPVPRDVVAETLWPDEDTSGLGNRLSVAVSLLRGVLDPTKRFDPERFVVTDKANVTLDLDAVVVDVEAFLAHAAAGFDLLRQGRRTEGLERLGTAEAAYTGDFLEEHLYDDWPVAVREEARATYLGVARALADAAAADGDPDREVRFRLRSLERDPYDEAAHLALVAAHTRSGAHGEARAAYRRYALRMEEIEVEAVAFPS